MYNSNTNLKQAIYRISSVFLGIDVVIFGLLIFAKLIYFNNIISGSDKATTGLIASVTGGVLIAICWTLLLPRFGRILSLYFTNLAVTFIIISDLVFYRYFSDVISVPVIMQASQVSSVGSSVASLIHFKDIIFLADLIALLPLLFYCFKKRSTVAYSSMAVRLLVSASVLSLGAYMVFYGADMLEKNQPKILMTFYDRAYVVEHIGLLSYHGFDAYRYIQNEKFAGNTLSEQDKQNIKKWFADKRNEKAKEPKLFGIGKGKNLIVIQVEALQNFVINQKINGMEITPNLNKLIKKSIYFNNYYCETARGGTSDAEFLANTSMFPIKEGSVYMRYSGNNYRSLPKTMKEQGYETMVMHAYKPGFWNRSVVYPNLGFDKFYNKNDYVHDEIIGMGVSDKSFFRQSLEMMKKHKEPFYAFMITLTSHYPYSDSPQYYSDFDVGEFKGTVMGNYLKAIHYADEAIGEFITGLEKEGLLDNTVVAIYGDHYALTKDSKEDLGKLLNIKDMNDFEWVRLQKVPMIIHLPGEEEKGTKNTAGGGVDFMPTLLNIMGVDTHNMPLMGRDLLNSEEGIAIMRNGYFIDDKHLCLTADGVAFEVKTGESCPVDKLKEKIDEVKTALNVTDQVIENNLIKEIEEYLKNSENK